MLSVKIVRSPTQTVIKVAISTASLVTVGNSEAVPEAFRKEKKLWQILHRSESWSRGHLS
jgi:hypothetical protein